MAAAVLLTMKPLLYFVVIDEPLFMKQKYHLFVDLHWVQGQPQRNSATLLPMIEQWILRFEAATYGHLPGILIVLPNSGGGVYSDEVIVHNDNFVDPNDPEVHWYWFTDKANGLR